MAKPASNLSSRAVQAHYEQPVSERMRTFMRLEFLYRQMLYNSELETNWACRATIGGLLEILAILSRGDVRSEVLKELLQHLSRYVFHGTQQVFITLPVVPGRVSRIVNHVEHRQARLHTVGKAAGPDQGRFGIGAEVDRNQNRAAPTRRMLSDF